MTLSKAPWVSAFFPLSARAIMSRAGLNFLSAFLCIERIMPRACARWEAAVTRSCTKLAPWPGRVFLKRSKASSSLRTLMVSAKATSSSARVLERSSHSCVFVPQLLSSSCKNFLSSEYVAEVSERSSFSCTMATPSSPICVVFTSTVAVRAATSFVFAEVRASQDAMDASSVLMSSASCAAMVSPISFKMPVICPLCGAYCEPWDKKAARSWRSDSTMSMRSLFAKLRINCAASVCKKLPAMPFSKAAMALAMATVLVPASVLTAANATASFSRMPVASFMASSAAARSVCACARSALDCSSFSSDTVISAVTSGILVSAAVMLADKSPVPVVQ
mmetsp:Transcript_36669/g.104353  ORF Transcript_36669/g.104353 Transcript_36669/m.104353 type:complete len:335 (+) Transcript_36669:359-1363(+)